MNTALPIPRLPQSIVEVSANYSPRTLLGLLWDNEASRVDSAARAALPNSGELLLLLSKLPDRANLRVRRQFIDLES